MRSPAPAPPIALADSSCNILGSKLCTGATIRPNFCWFFLFYKVFGSFFLYLSSFSSLLFNFFLFISSYSSSSYSSLIFNCLLSFLGVFLRGQAFFDPFGVKINVYTPDATILFFSSYLFLLFSSYSSRSIFFLFLFLSIIYSSRILCLSSCRPVIFLSSCHPVCRSCGTLSYSLCYSNQTDEGDETEGFKREGLEMER